ncbi:class I SAM-dependent methyltransferase [Chondromyces crocatus]|nr:class I SAM-dependent methyltransferase [Chondromyces crocatus]
MATIDSSRRAERDRLVAGASIQDGRREETTIALLDPIGEEYRRAFSLFLAHTDQKDVARVHLTDVVAQLPEHHVFLDVGAGSGRITRWFTESFEQTIAIEPSPHMREQLAQACPTARIIPDTIMNAEPGVRADFVLCSHSFYYVPADRWATHLRRMLGWLSDGGEMVLILQNPRSDCMEMVHHFSGQRIDIGELVQLVHGEPDGADYSVRLETLPSLIETPDVGTAITIAEFIVNLIPLDEPPPYQEVRDYVQRHFADPSDRCRLTCSQDFVRIRRR